jgi:aspartyl-tRNA(Asn)/glutamyl-tRNA(Gln) amidotransferase subunit A
VTAELELTISEVRLELAHRALSATELVGAALAQIERLEPMINAFVAVDGELALAAAARADVALAAGDPRPLLGIPVSCKDNVDVQGLPGTAASAVLAGRRPTRDATVAHRLREAGAILIGKNNMDEFCLGATTDNPHYGRCRNPWDPSRIAGGSSGGSAAAVAARECFASIGTDTGGSIRIPAAANGVVGVRPSLGRVSNQGIIPLAWSLDAAGPLCRSAADAALLLEIIAGHDPHDPRTESAAVPAYTDVPRDGLDGVRIGVDPQDFTSLESDTGKALGAALSQLEDLGGELVEVSIPDADLSRTAEWVVELAEAAAAHRRWLHQSEDRYGEASRRLLRLGEAQAAVHYIQAQRFRRRLQAKLDELFVEVDVIVRPSLPLPAPSHRQDTVSLGGDEHALLDALTRFTYLPGQVGCPAVSVPCGTASHLPVALQIVGRPFDEATVLSLAQAYERAAQWTFRPPATNQPCREPDGG